MGYFKDAASVYETLGQFVTTLVDSPGVGARLRKLDGAVRLSLSDPEATVTVCLRPNGSVQFGSSFAPVDLTLETPADLFHEALLGEASVRSGLAEGQISARGQLDGLSALWPLITFVSAGPYRAIVQSAQP